VVHGHTERAKPSKQIQLLNTSACWQCTERRDLWNQLLHLAVLAVAAAAAVHFGPAGFCISESFGPGELWRLHPASVASRATEWVVHSLHLESAKVHVCLSIALALIVERWFESPLQRWAKRNLHDKKAAPPRRHVAGTAVSTGDDTSHL
jgi:hypothetical protein